MLLRNPLGFTWRYALGWSEPDQAKETMDLDALTFGNLVHGMLDHALTLIEATGGLGSAATPAILAAVTAARAAVTEQWEAEQAVPPVVLWSMRLDEAEYLAVRALTWPLTAYGNQRSHGELPFGGASSPRSSAPWDVTRDVTVPGTPFRIRGRIDRLDLSDDGQIARVIDYKTGKPRTPGTLDGGKELQRCLYAYAVQSLLGPAVTVEAALLYPRAETDGYHSLKHSGAALLTLTTALLRAHDNLQAGRALPGPDTGGDYDDLLFALPASTGAMIHSKRLAAKALMGDAALIWDAE
jgi:RecB family exonuclease